MRKIKKVLRLHFEKGLSAREIARSLDIGRGTIRNYLDRVQQVGLSWLLAPEIDEAALEHGLFLSIHPVAQEKRQKLPVEYLHQELKRRKGAFILQASANQAWPREKPAKVGTQPPVKRSRSRQRRS